MSWRRGELWFDSEVLWLGEPAPALAGAGPVPAPLPGFGPPPGLVASRLRRAAWKRRREARRAKATAIALSPAVVLALAGLRSGGGPGSGLLLEDPPSLTFRLSTKAIAPDDMPARVRPEAHETVAAHGPRPADRPRPPHESVPAHHADVPAAPRIAWRHARS